MHKTVLIFSGPITGNISEAIGFSFGNIPNYSQILLCLSLAKYNSTMTMG